MPWIVAAYFHWNERWWQQRSTWRLMFTQTVKRWSWTNTANSKASSIPPVNINFLILLLLVGERVRPAVNDWTAPMDTMSKIQQLPWDFCTFLHFSVWQHFEFSRGHCLKFAGRLCANIILLRTRMLHFVFCPRQQPCITSLMTAELSKQLRHNKLEKSPDRPDSLKHNLGYNLEFLAK